MIYHKERFAWSSALAVALLLATAPAVAQPLAGQSPPGVTAAEFEEFRLGLDDFLEVETAEEGLGPAFNGTSCAAATRSPLSAA